MRRLNSSPTTRHELFSALAESELLTPHQFVKADAAVAATITTADAAAQILVAAKLLTTFQAARLLAGRSDGFILGQHVIQEQVGKGSVGRVYRATHRAMNRSVAIKVMSADVTRTAAARMAFQREVRAAARLNHPNIVTAYDANEVGDRFYLVLEFVNGPTLETLVRERGPLPWQEACRIVRQVALGLQHAHDQGMVHRDVKPANLLVCRPSPSMPGFTVKIADFGIAKFTPLPANVSTPAAGLTGTPDYVSPEQAYNPQLADHRADLYSLGCVLFFLLMGRPPFPGGPTEEKIRRHQFEPPATIPHAPPAVAELVAKLLAKDPAQRPASAQAVAVWIERFGVNTADENGTVGFDLPPVQPGPYSFASRVHNTARASADTSPWSQLTDEEVDSLATAVENLDDTPFVPPPRRKNTVKRSGMPGFVVLGLCATVVLASTLGLFALIKLAGKSP